MNKIALKKFVIIRYLDSCHKYPYGYGKYTESVGDFRITSLISDIIDYHHPHKDSIYRDEAKRINGTKSTILIVISVNTLKCFGYCLMMEQIPICGQLIPFAVGLLIATKKNWKRNWICIFNSN